MICRFAANDDLPVWLPKGFISVTRTDEELSIVCKQLVIKGVRCERDWRIIKIVGPLDFSEIGVLARISGILANESISIFVVSTFDTDYILIKADKLKRAIGALQAAGYQIEES